MSRVKEEPPIAAIPPCSFTDPTPSKALEGDAEVASTRLRGVARRDATSRASDREGSGHGRRHPPSFLHHIPRLRSPIGFHVVLRLQDDRPLMRNEADMRVLARVVLGQGETRGLIAFGAADNHLHAQLATDRATAGAFALYVATSLRWQLALGAPFEPARVRPLTDQSHAYNTFRYVQRQDAHHAVNRDPTREATSLPDLLGLRVLPTTIASRVRAHLPRVTPAVLAELFPSCAGDVSGPDAPLAADLVEAAKAAFALPHLRGHGGIVGRARSATVHAGGASISARDLRDALGVSLRTVYTLRAEPADPATVRAVLLQARIRARVLALAAPR